MWIIILVVLLQGYPIDTMDYRGGANRPTRFFSHTVCKQVAEERLVTVWEDLKMKPNSDITFVLKCVEVTP